MAPGLEQRENGDDDGTSLRVTPSQTAGPYLGIGLPWPDGSFVVPPGTPGAITVTGRVLASDGAPLPDVLIETWQADPEGRFNHPDDPRGAVTPKLAGFRGFGRSMTDADGRYLILTLLPGPLPCPGGGTEAPHLDVSIFARGLLDRLVTRMYFGDQVTANAADPVLRRVDPRRRATLIAERAPGNPSEFWLDIRLRGENETVFFDV
jgi:protocatechuate 3,4-dioxygenase, alpha subunit